MMDHGLLGVGVQETQQSAPKEHMMSQWILQSTLIGWFVVSSYFEAFGHDTGHALEHMCG